MKVLPDYLLVPPNRYLKHPQTQNLQENNTMQYKQPVS